jgi:hypothetical protein
MSFSPKRPRKKKNDDNNLKVQIRVDRRWMIPAAIGQASSPSALWVFTRGAADVYERERPPPSRAPAESGV